jgi:hypothetical protein
MSETNKDTWGEYSKLVLKELQRLNDNHERMRTDLEFKFQEINSNIATIKTVEKNLSDQKIWLEKVNDVWSPMQMKEAKDEIYKQKSRWVAAIAIVTFTQILVGLIVAAWRNMR